MWSTIIRLYLLLIVTLFEVLCDSDKIRFISTEHPEVTYYNPKFTSYANLTSQRYGRYNPIYYVGFHFSNVVPFDNNVTVDFYFLEWLTNRYKRSFVEMKFKWCDMIHKDPFFGAALKQGKLALPCPHMPGDYNAYNMTIALNVIPPNFPFTKGRIVANVTTNNRKEIIGYGHIDMEIKEVRLRKKKE